MAIVVAPDSIDPVKLLAVMMTRGDGNMKEIAESARHRFVVSEPTLEGPEGKRDEKREYSVWVSILRDETKAFEPFQVPLSPLCPGRRRHRHLQLQRRHAPGHRQCL
jgi:hypothetical protein